MTNTELIDRVDKMLFDATVLALDATTQQKRLDTDRKITEARIELDKLRSRYE